MRHNKTYRKLSLWWENSDNFTQIDVSYANNLGGFYMASKAKVYCDICGTLIKPDLPYYIKSIKKIHENSYFYKATIYCFNCFYDSDFIDEVYYTKI